jgi:uncharacterized protein with NAD-binding domain and iron-sulfur cluster
VLGGGVGAMTAAYYLAPHHDVSVHQLGWRLGGKGASGRNMEQDMGARIEEHGLHIWFGFYQNGFRLMRDCYKELDRPPGHPLREWDDAFKQHDVITLMEEAGTPPQWARPWIVNFPPNDRKPGGPAASQPQRIDNLISLTEWLSLQIETYLATQLDPSDDAFVRKSAFTHDVHHHVKEITAILKATKRGLLAEIILAITRMVQALLEVTTRYMLPQLESDADFRRIVYLIDLSIAAVTGFVRSNLLVAPWDSIDHLDFHEWLMLNGLTPFSRWCSPVRAVYDLAFGYREGLAEESYADMAAGSTLRGLLWMVFGYDGSIMWKMQAGMGDTVFSPIYEVLTTKHKVPFYFFHKVLDLVPSDDGTHIEKIVIGIQAEPLKGSAGYHPLVDVNDLGCWPSDALLLQLKDGELLKGINFEDPNSPHLQTIELVAGVDFDHIIFGLSVGSVRDTCSRLIAQKPAWKEMVEHVRTVATQAFQLWLNKDIKELGWPPALDGSDGGERAVVGTFVEPLDTWADMSQLIVREQWPPEAGVKNIAYFCGPFDEVFTSPVEPLDRVRMLAKAYVENDIQTLWKNTVPTGTFPWDWLVDLNGNSGIDRFWSQYFRVNYQQSERYVLSVAGSTRYRLHGNDTGYSNLSIAGDWNRNTLSLGCVESACMGGLDAIKDLVPGLRIIDEDGGAEVGKDLRK